MNGNDGLPLPNEDGNNSLNSIKRLSNDQFSDKDDMRMKRQVKNLLVTNYFCKVEGMYNSRHVGLTVNSLFLLESQFLRVFKTVLIGL